MTLTRETTERTDGIPVAPRAAARQPGAGPSPSDVALRTDGDGGGGR
jgi:hypothetical protein